MWRTRIPGLPQTAHGELSVEELIGIDGQNHEEADQATFHDDDDIRAVICTPTADGIFALARAPVSALR